MIGEGGPVPGRLAPEVAFSSLSKHLSLGDFTEQGREEREVQETDPKGFVSTHKLTQPWLLTRSQEAAVK